MIVLERGDETWPAAAAAEGGWSLLVRVRLVGAASAASPDTGTPPIPTLTVTIDRHNQKAYAQWRSGQPEDHEADLTVLPATFQHSSEGQTAIITLGDLPLQLPLASELGQVTVVALAAPWRATSGWWLKVLRPGRRTLVVAAAAWDGNEWFDGPLAHIIADGTFASYLPSGGAGFLTIPVVPIVRNHRNHRSQGMLPEAALSLDDSPRGSLAIRCLVAQLRARIAAHLTSQKQTSVDNALQLSLTDFTVDHAVLLVFIRRAFPRSKIVVHTALPLAQWPPAWRRLCENLGACPKALSARQRAQLQSMPSLSGLVNDASDLPSAIEPLDVANLRDALAGFDLAILIEHLNSLSEVLPKGVR